MATIVTRSGKGSPLTHAEVDANFTNLNTDKLELSGGTMTGNLSFGDNDKAIFGAGSDLQIYHDGSNSNIKDVGTGPLKIFATDLYINNSAGNKTHLSGIDGGAVTLYYNGSSKLATTSTGIDVTGTVTADALTISAAPSPKIQVTDSDDSNTAFMQADGANGGYFGTLTNHPVRIAPNNSTKMIVTTAGNVGIGTASPSRTLTLVDATSDGSGGLLIQNYLPVIELDDASGGGTSTIIKHDGTNTIIENGGSERLRIDSSGQVGIGTSSPSAKLNVVGSAADNGISIKSGGNGGVDPFKVTWSGGTEGDMFIVDDSGNVGIGTSSPARSPLHLNVASGDATIHMTNGSTGSTASDGLSIFAGASLAGLWYREAGSLQFATNSTERMRISSAGLVGIGTSSPAGTLHLHSADTGLRLTSSQGSNTPLAQLQYSGSGGYFLRMGDSADNEDVMIRTYGNSHFNGGNVGIGTTSPSAKLHSNVGAASTIGVLAENANDAASTGDLIKAYSARGDTSAYNLFKAQNSTGVKFLVSGDGNVGIGTSSPSSYNSGGYRLVVGDGAGYEGITIASGSTQEGSLYFADGTTGNETYRGHIAYNHSNDSMHFKTAATERMRIDSSGNLLVSKTSTSVSNAGVVISSSQGVRSTVDGNVPVLLNRLTSDGNLIDLRKDGTVIGTLGSNTTSGQTLLDLSATQNFRLLTNGSERMRIDSSGHVGIGRTAPSHPLHIGDTSGNTILELQRTNTNASGTIGAISFTASDDHSVAAIHASGDGDNEGAHLIFRTTSAASQNNYFNSTSERMRIDSSGNLLLGTTSLTTGTLGTGNTFLEIAGDSGGSGTLTISRPSDTNTEEVGGIRFANANNADDDGLDADGKLIAAISARTATSDSNAGDDAGGDLVFYTKPEAGNYAERMRILSNGTVVVGTTSSGGQYNGTGNNGLGVNSAGQNGQYVTIQNMSDANLYLSKKTGYTDNRAIAFAVAGSSVGTVTVSASATAYNTSSDHRLKENVVDLTGATTRLKQLEPKRFNFIADADTTVDGFLAHEVQAVVPEAITGTHNEVDADGNPVYQGIDQSKLVPLLVATIKELEARITALENA